MKLLNLGAGQHGPGQWAVEQRSLWPSAGRDFQTQKPLRGRLILPRKGVEATRFFRRRPILGAKSNLFASVNTAAEGVNGMDAFVNGGLRPLRDPACTDL